jgi:competence protein ComEC
VTASVTEAVPKAPPDLRLLPAAAGAWLGAIAGNVLVPVTSWWVAGGLVALAAWSRRRAAVAVLLIMLAAGVIVAAIGRQSRTTGVVADLARRAGVGRAELTVTSDPQPLPVQPHLPPGVLIQAKIRAIDTNRRRWSTDQPVVVLAPAASWARLLPSTRVAASAEFRAPHGSDVAAVVVVRRRPVMIRGPSRVQRWAGRIRGGLRTAAGGLPDSERGLLPGLVVGDTSLMPAADTADFRAAGLTHLTAVSGANLAVVVAAVFGLLRWSPLGIRMRALVSAGVLLGFVTLARPTPSVLRAAGMGLLALAAIALGRPRALLPGLLGTVTGLALFVPTLATRPGFALSVLATLALLVLAPGWTTRLREWLPRRLAPLAPALTAPLAAQVACMPVIAAISGAVSLAAVPANLLALPAVPITTVLGLLAAGVSLASPGLAGTLCQAAGVPCRWLIMVAHAAARLPLATVTAPSGGLGLVCVAFVTTGLVVAVRSRGGRRTLVFTAVILTAATLAGFT